MPSRSPSTSATDLLETLRATVVDGPGTLDASVRRAAFAGEPVPDEAQRYVDKVRGRAYTVTDDDVDALKAAGWTDDQLFELTVSAALGTALWRRDLARKAMGR